MCPSTGEIFAQLDAYVSFAFKQSYVALLMWLQNALLTHGISLAELHIKFSTLGRDSEVLKTACCVLFSKDVFEEM